MIFLRARSSLKNDMIVDRRLQQKICLRGAEGEGQAESRGVGRWLLGVWNAQRA